MTTSTGFVLARVTVEEAQRRTEPCQLAVVVA
jgi:hypothetical protein